MVTPAPFPASGRRLFGLAAASLLLHTGALAQAGVPSSPGYGAGLRVTPWLGWATGTTRDETWSYTGNAGAPVRESVAMRLASGPAAGIVLQVPVSGPFDILAGAAYLDRDDARFSIGGGEPWVFTGSRSVLLKAGLGMAFRAPGDELAVRRLGAGLVVAPFYMLESPREIAGIQAADLFDAASHFGVNLGLTGELPFARDRFALQLGFEDYLTFWNRDQLQRLPDWLHDAPGGSGTTVTADPTHQWLVRAGVTLRLH